MPFPGGVSGEGGGRGPRAQPLFIINNEKYFQVHRYPSIAGQYWVERIIIRVFVMSNEIHWRDYDFDPYPTI